MGSACSPVIHRSTIMKAQNNASPAAKCLARNAQSAMPMEKPARNVRMGLT